MFTEFYKRYKNWKLLSKLSFWGFILGIIVIPSISILYGPEIHNYFIEKKGIEIFPMEINYGCSPLGLTKTITVTNYDDEPKTDIQLSFSWPYEIQLKIIPIGSGPDINRIIPISMISADNLQTYKEMPLLISSLKPKESLQFDFKFMVENCTEDFIIYINKNNSIKILSKI